MSAESLLVILLVGLIAGWLAGQIVRGTGFGLIADMCIGIVGALIVAGCYLAWAYTLVLALWRRSSQLPSAPYCC